MPAQNASSAAATKHTSVEAKGDLELVVKRTFCLLYTSDAADEATIV